MYLGWYDPDKKTTAAVKLAAACDRYERKWGRRPRVAFVNPETASAISTAPLGVEIRPAGHVAPNTFFVGEDDDA